MTLSRALIPAALCIALLGCTGKVGDIGELPDTETGTSAETETSGETDVSASGPDGESSTGSTTADSSPSGSTQGTESTGESGEPAVPCEDRDRDQVPFEDDNAPYVPNPHQSDLDNDGIGDRIDLCPTVAPGTVGAANNAADSDNDGIGNDCDRCGSTIEEYNSALPGDVPLYIQVRSIPTNADFDGDGIGDACDNCIATANCGDWDGASPHTIGESTEGAADCQVDDNADGIGDACEGVTGVGAAGPVGLGTDDDFDQDGLTNGEDGCPRLPLSAADRIPCAGPGECPAGRTCAADGVCNHLDSDQDGIGDICDTCSGSANEIQLLEGGAQEDDEDGDFVGASCETAPACAERSDPRPFGFHEVSAYGACCVPALIEAGDGSGDLLITSTCDVGDDGLTSCLPLLAPHPEDATRTLPVREQCDGDDCAALEVRVANRAGVLNLPPGCDEALSEAGLTVEQNLRPLLREPQSSPAALAEKICQLPSLDTDFDGIGDVCDNCPYAFDPSEAPYIDSQGRLWPIDGAFCNGEYACF